VNLVAESSYCLALVKEGANVVLGDVDMEPVIVFVKMGDMLKLFK